MVPIKPVPAGLAPESDPSNCTPPQSRVFLLSPANTSAIRGQLLLNRTSEFELAQRIRRQGAPLRELFSFISSLYFRGKLAYAEAFSQSPTGFPSTLVMTTSRGLLPPETVITLDDLLEMSVVPIDPGDPRYRDPLCRDARALACGLPAGSQIVLLGSIASGNYGSGGGYGGRGIEVTVQRDDGQQVTVAQRDDGDIQLGDRVQVVQNRQGVAQVVRDTSRAPD